jgi:hypothetical protein
VRAAAPQLIPERGLNRIRRPRRLLHPARVAHGAKFPDGVTTRVIDGPLNSVTGGSLYRFM